MSQYRLYLDFNFLMNPDLVREKIKQLLKEKRLSIAKAEKMSGIGPTVLRCFLNGQTKNPKIETLSSFAKTMGIELSKLIETTDQELETNQKLPWKGRILAELSNILEDLLEDRKVQLENSQILPILLEVYYTYCNKQQKDMDRDLIKLFFKRALDKYI
jgi:transcriptional regulator with XRE-family HTH domain